ncbi:MAG: hypothetical protein ABS36_14070 [Acidobacteria bacterium SCN 69-37]|nr:MAG: hypothetical protein ABS36_14070 [Acidobacteria bacterium SCN 69-37]
MDTHLVPGARFVDPKVLARVKDLELLAKTVVDGVINGLHRAPHFGASVDFAEHRGYVAGDDIRRVDWRLYARTDRYFIKQYEADTNANLAILLDVSKSMAFASQGVSKLEYAKFLAACLAYLSHRQRDRVGITTFDEAIVTHVPPSAKHFNVLLHTLDRAVAEKPGRLLANLDLLAERFRRRSIVVLISDLYEEPDRLIDAIKPYSFGGNDVVVFHVLDPAEIAFPYDEPSRFVDLESGDEVPVVPERFAEQYRQMVQEHIAALRARCTDARIDYALIETSTPLDQALFDYLGHRERLMRVR